MPSEPAWLPPRLYWQARPDPDIRPWLLADGSLTAALVNLSGGAFRVRVTRERWERPRPDERRALNLPPRLYARVREVELLGRDEVWVTARSILPVTTLRGPGGRLRYLGNRSLGSLLFKGRARRGPLAIRCRDGHWERHSCFFYHGQPLLVRERFLPALFAAARQGKLG